MRRPVAHDLAVERERGDRRHDRHAEDLADPLSPRCDRIGHHVVRFLGAIRVQLFVQQLGRRAHEEPRELVHPASHGTEFRQEGVAVRPIRRAGRRDERARTHRSRGRRSLHRAEPARVRAAASDWCGRERGGQRRVPSTRWCSMPHIGRASSALGTERATKIRHDGTEETKTHGEDSRLAPTFLQLVAPRFARSDSVGVRDHEHMGWRRARDPSPPRYPSRRPRPACDQLTRRSPGRCAATPCVFVSLRASVSSLLRPLRPLRPPSVPLLTARKPAARARSPGSFRRNVLARGFDADAAGVAYLAQVGEKRRVVELFPGEREHATLRVGHVQMADVVPGVRMIAGSSFSLAR